MGTGPLADSYETKPPWSYQLNLRANWNCSRIVSCRWLPGQTRGARRGIAQLVHCGDVGVIGKIESIGNQVEAEAFAEVDGLGDAQVKLKEKWHNKFVAPQVANAPGRWRDARNTKHTAVVRKTGLRDAERGAVNIWRNGGPAGRRPILRSAEVKPRVGTGDYVEGPARRNSMSGATVKLLRKCLHECVAIPCAEKSGRRRW